MLVYADYTHGFFLGWLCRTFEVIPIKATAGPKSILRALKTAREAIQKGDLVCIFPEGELTRTGQMQPFQRGMMRIIQGIDAPVIPTYLDELWGSIFSYRGGKFFWKWPARWPYPVSIHFGKPLHSPEDVREVQQAVENLGADAVSRRK
jgi:acyl-[acyl-carrier-protein]-phospholipid O-acyltransferase/long-chain-fatty-acid--[acyl-carrier-protein] ligase